MSGRYKWLFYGGAIRGGKSYCVMAVIFTLCRLFPGSRWAIVRKDLPTLRRNILPVFEKLKPASCSSMNQQTWEATFTNGSKIILFPESFTTDKEHERWKGLEVNGFWLEEANELQESSWTWAIQRAGSYVIPATLTNPEPRQPLPYILLTSNPATNWVKRIFYTPWKQGQLRAPYYYIPATIHDNPSLPQSYLDSLENLPERDYKVYVLGSWDELAGAALEELHEKMHIIPAVEIPDHWMRFGAFDWGYRHPFSFGLYAASSERIFKVETISGRGMSDAAMIAYIAEVAKEMKFPATELEYVVAGKDAFHDVQARANIGETTAERFHKAGIPMIAADTSRISGLKNMREMTAWQKVGPNGTPGIPRFALFDTPSNRACFEQLQNMVLDPDRPEDVLKVDANPDTGLGGDDFYDETRYALQSRAEAHTAPTAEVGEDVHPGYDIKKRERLPRRQRITDPEAIMDDDLRPNLYRVPRQVGGGWRMPRYGGDEVISDNEDEY
jgi:phage terminase large subunit